MIRGATVSAGNVSTQGDPLSLRSSSSSLILPVIVGGCATYRAALHLMRAGAAGVLVGFGGAPHHHDVLGIRVPMASAVADIASGPTGLPG